MLHYNNNDMIKQLVLIFIRKSKFVIYVYVCVTDETNRLDFQ